MIYHERAHTSAVIIFNEGRHTRSSLGYGLWDSGFYDANTTFGVGEPNETTLTWYQGIFVAEYDAAGKLKWAGSVGGENIGGGFDAVYSIAVDKTGNTYFIADFSGTSIFNGGETNETILTSKGRGSVLVAKY